MNSPRFKKGDYIIFNNSDAVYLILEVRHGQYSLVHQQGWKHEGDCLLLAGWRDCVFVDVHAQLWM